MTSKIHQDSGSQDDHLHAEAFCLMRYTCKLCQHSEIIWNSRDGVTPFGTSCPSCGEPTLNHSDFGSDKYAPDHKPHKGQRVWVSMTIERAEKLAKRMILSRIKRGIEANNLIKKAAERYYNNGIEPDLRIEGYTEQD